MKASPLKTFVKATAIMFVVGAALAAAAPYLSTAIFGMSVAAVEAAHPVAWLGVFFGAFGALAAVVNPAFDWLLGDRKPSDVSLNPPMNGNGNGAEHVHVHVDLNGLSQPEIIEAKYRNLIEAQRAVALSQQPQR